MATFNSILSASFVVELRNCLRGSDELFGGSWTALLVLSRAVDGTKCGKLVEKCAT